MIKFGLGFNENPGKDDILSDYRERLMYRFSLVLAVLFLPLMIFNFRRGEQQLGAAIGCVLVIVVINAAASYFDRNIPVARTLFIVGLAALVGVALFNRAAYGTYWTFPVVVIISFSAPRKMAKIYAALFFVYISFLSFYLLSFGLALRAVVGLCVTIIFTNIFLDVIEKLQEKLIAQSLRDPLTKAFNRRQMTASLEEAIERKRRAQSPASILIIDIDNFKGINDDYGHSVGDQVLKEFVALVDRRARRFDQLFRIGGEEFMLFLPDTPAEGALKLAEELRLLISQAELTEHRRVTVSIGLSELNTGETIDEWMKHGDDALYAAKENGRNQVFSRMSPVISNCLNIDGGNFLDAAH